MATGNSVGSLGGVAEADVLRHELLDLLREPAQVVLLCAPAGSGKTSLLRSWIDQSEVADSVAWLSVAREERDPEQFWISVLDALRSTAAGSALVRELTQAPGLDGWTILERVLDDLGSLEDPTWLVIDNLHELRSDETLRQLELLLMRMPDKLRCVLSTRHHLRLGLHRLRLDGALTEILSDDLRFTGEEARALLETADIELSDLALSRLLQRTEGWAAGLRLAAVSLAGHPDPERFALQFSGSERTVAEYLLAEVLERQPEAVRKLLVRTSILERVNGQLADLLTGESDGDRILLDLERDNAFVVSLNLDCSWFRYRCLFADLLVRELRRIEPDALPALHGLAAGWYADHGYPVEAIRHAQAAGDWGLASRLLCDHWFGLRLDGQRGVAHQLLTAFPARVLGADPELVALRAADELDRGSLHEAERCLDWAARESGSVPPGRRLRFTLRLATRRLRLARRRGDLSAVVEEAQRLLAPADAEVLGVSEDQRAVALIELGIGEMWSGRTDHMDRHFAQGIALARRIGRPYLEVNGLSHWAMGAAVSSSSLAVQRGMDAIELARRHGWSDEPVVAVAYLALGAVDLWRGQLQEAGAWFEHADRVLRPELEPAAAAALGQHRGLLEHACNRPEAAVAAFAAAERYSDLLVSPQPVQRRVQADRLHALLCAGEVEKVEQAVSALDDSLLQTAEMLTTLASLRLAQGEPDAARSIIAPVLDGAVHALSQARLALALLVDARAAEAQGDGGSAQFALERALELAEADGALLPFLLYPVPDLLGRHRRHRTSHACLASEIRDLLTGNPASPQCGPEPLPEALSTSETHVLRYLPTNLLLRDIAGELHVSAHTVKTHIKHIYAKMGVHSRAEAVERARSLGLLAPSTRGR